MTIYRNLQIFDGISSSLMPGDLGVEHGRFSDSASGASKDMAGLYAIPGLIDAHIHLCLNPEIHDPFEQDKPAENVLLEQMRERAHSMLLAGITSARDLGGGAHLELRIRDEILAGSIPGPRLICAGQPVTSPGGHCHFWGGEAGDTEAALVVVARQHERGVDLIKVMATGGNITPGSRPVDSQFEEDTLAAVVAAATEHGYHVAAHCHGTQGIGQAARAGVRTIEHCSWVSDAGWARGFDAGVASELAKDGVWVSPTINSGWKRFRDETYLALIQGNYAEMKSQGVRLIASTDAGIPNIFHDDLPRALPEFARFSSLSNEDVLKAATSHCAEALGLAAVTGRIADGYSADFVLYEADPLKDLSVLERPVLVVARGEEFRPAG